MKEKENNAINENQNLEERLNSLPDFESKTNRIARRFSKTNSKANKKRIITKKKVSLMILLISILTVILVSYFSFTKKANKYGAISQENLRAMNYAEFQDGDDAVYKDGTQGTGNEEVIDNVKFSSFFLRDLDGDGYAEKLKGTCKEIGKQDTLYMEIIVQTAGYLKNGKLQIDGKNFYMQTALPKDNELKENYIGNNIKTIEFENLNNGTQKLLTGMVKSGDYSYSSGVRDAIGNNINNYSRQDNKIILTGTYVAEDGTETEIRKEIDLEMDWYGITSASINTNTQNYYDIANRINEGNGTFTTNFSVNTYENKKYLNLSSNYTEGTIPQLNGYNPISVTQKSGGGDFSYDAETRKFTITRNAVTDENGIITTSVATEHYNTIEVVYPLEAYESIGSEMVTIKIPVSTYYEGYNNPNTEFSNPYKSNVAKATLVANYMPVREEGASFEIRVGKYISSPNWHYMISKRKPLRLYNGISSEEIDDLYEVSWSVYTGTNGKTTGLVLKETKDEEEQKVDTFIKTDSTEDSMEEMATNVGIYFVNADDMLETDGEIKVYDEDTGILVHTFTSKDWNNYTQNSPYKYETAIKHVKVVTSKTKAKASLYVCNVKELDDEKIVESYTKEDFDNLQYIKSSLVAYLGGNYLGTKVHQANYETPYSIANISVSKDVLSTQRTEKGVNIFIETVADTTNNQIEWTNGDFLVKLPDEILVAKINSVIIDNSSVKIDSYELIENENGKFIKIKTTNVNPKIYNITINADMTADPRIPSVTKPIILYAKNEESESYYYSGVDSHDVDENGNTEELVNVTSKNISIIAPNSLLTNQTMSEYDENGSIVVSPQIADLKPIYGDDDREKQTVRIGMQMRNNYSSTISEITMVGKIPFEGNTYVLSGGDMKSDFSTTMKNSGITIPEELNGKVTVYYSTNENPSKDLTDINNGWTLKEDVEDWAEIKSWAIDFKDTVISPGKEYNFYYTIEIPFGVEFNDVAYSHHGIYFCLDTPEGKYRTKTEPNKVGVRITDKYNLLLTKYQKNKEKLIQGATYRVSKLDIDGNVEDSQTAITNAEGILEMANLYAEKIYEIKEVQSPSDYELNEDSVKIIAHVDRTDGTLTVEKVVGTTKDNLQVIKNEGEDYKVSAKVEDEVKVTLKLTKFEQGTGTRIRGVRYSITGYGMPDSGRKATTNTSGEITLRGLKIGEEYTLEEVKAEGYYLASPIRIKVENHEGTYAVQIVDGTVKASSVIFENELPIANIDIEDEKIPRFDLIINKIEKGTGVGEVVAVPVVGAKFKLFKENIDQGEYITDSEGHIRINDLYQYVEGKDFEATYTLKEIFAPEGYAKTGDITFKAQVVDDELTLISEDTNNFTVEGTVINLTVEDSPSFKLVKKDGETNALLPNVKFAIYDVSEGEVPARNSKGEIIGTKETINGREYYTVTTNENGEITADLPEGLYKAVEVEAPVQYDIEGQEEYFGIGKSREGKKETYVDCAFNVGGASIDSISKVLPNIDNGYIAIGTFTGNIDLKNGETLNNNGNTDIMIIKYNEYNECEWAKSIGSNGRDTFGDAIFTSDKNYIIGCNIDNSRIALDNGEIVETNTSSSYMSLIVKYNIDGDIIWAKSIEKGNINSIKETSDGGYLIAGSCSSNVNLDNNVSLNINGNSDGVLIKYNQDGIVEWGINVGGNTSDNFYSAIQTSDGGYLVGGYFYSSSIDFGNDISIINYGSTDIMLIKYNSNRDIEWVKTIFGTGSDFLSSIIEMQNGDYLVCGKYMSPTVSFGDGFTAQNNTSNYDSFICRYNKDGNIISVKTINGAGQYDINEIIETSNGDYYIAGDYYENGTTIDDITLPYGGSYNGMILKMNSNLEVIWAQTLNEGSDQIIYSITELSNGEYLIGGSFYSSSVSIAGKTITNNGSLDGLIIKIKEVDVPEPILKDAKNIGGTGNDRFSKVVPTSDGGYLVGGRFASSSIDLGNGQNIGSHGSDDGMLIKYDENGECEWGKSISGSNEDSITSIIQTTDGGYLVGGYFKSSSIDLGNEKNISNHGSTYFSDGMLIKYDENGECEWGKSIGGASFDKITSVTETGDGGYIAGGYFSSSSIDLGNGTSISNHGSYDGMIIKYSKNHEVEWAKSVGGTGADYIETMISTKDEGYLVGGMFEIASTDFADELGINLQDNKDSRDGMIIKYDKEGRIEWADYLSGKVQSSTSDITSLVETSDGGYIVGGVSKSKGIIRKYNREGTLIWQKELKSSPYGISVCDVIESNDGCYLITGEFYYYEDVLIDIGFGKMIKAGGNEDGFVIKIDSDGICQWIFNTRGKTTDALYSIAEISDNNYIVVGAFGFSNVTDDINIADTRTLISNGCGEALIIKICSEMGVTEISELGFINDRKEFKITTDINEIDRTKGGSISGEDKAPYEKVKYGDNSTKEIKMIPDENYEIIGITVNGEEYPFETLEDGSYTMPQFENVTEDKHVIVTYSLKDNKITINKVDNVSREVISDVTFKLDQIEEREEPIISEIIGELTNNGQEYTEVEVGEEITGKIGELTNNGTYYFVEKDGKYVPTNSKTYQIANGGTTGVQNSIAWSYIPIDLTGVTGKYVVSVNAEIVSEGADPGVAFITENTTVPSYSSSTNRFIYISGTKTASDYLSQTLDGGKIYYLHLGYRKDGSVDTGEDQIIINSVKLYTATESTETYNFINNNGKYESTNNGKDNTTSNSYIPIDLTDYTGKYNLIVNAEVSSQSSGDYGYATITENTNRVAYNSTTGQFIYISGTQSAKDYTIELQAGKMYYLHLGYYKNANTSSGDDKFTVNSIHLSLNDSELYHTTVTTNSEGQAITQIPFGKYEVTETNSPEGYWPLEDSQEIEFRSYDGAQHEFTIENEKKAKVIVHHYIKGTETKLAEDEEIFGKIDDKYSTEPKINLDKYTLEKDVNNDYILPENANGTMTYEDIIVTYYYVEKETPLIVHHYIEGTETKVPLANGNVAEDVISSGHSGEEYTTEAIEDNLLNSNYELKEVPENANGIYGEDEVVVTYYYKEVEREVTITKVDKDDENIVLSNVKFELSDGKDHTIGALKNNGTYYFKKASGKLVSNNTGISNSTANSYIKIDLTNKGNKTIKVNAEISSESSYDIGYATVTETIEAPLYNNSTNRFIYISGTQSAREYTKTLTGGKVYYLHLGYYKDASTNTGTDTFIINEIKLDEDIYDFNTKDFKSDYETNQNGQITLNLKTGNYTLKEKETIDGYVLSEEEKDFTVNKGTENQNIKITNEKVKGIVIAHYYIQGTTNKVPKQNGEEIQDVIIENSIGTIYATSVAENVHEYYELASEPENKQGTIVGGTTEVFYYYRLKPAKVTVHHYLKGTTTKVAEDEEKIGQVTQNYTTNPKDLDDYVLEKDSNNQNILPANQNGIYTLEDQEVTYYYVQRVVPLTVHHYVQGTETKVPLANGETAEDEHYTGVKNEQYITSAINTGDLHEYYELASVPSNANGTYGGRNEIVVIYYYKKVSKNITFNKVDEDGVTLLNGAQFELTYKDIPSGTTYLDLNSAVNSGIYGFTKSNGKLISNNRGVANSTANAYITLDTRNDVKNVTLYVNETISSQSGYDIGYVTVTESSSVPAYNNSTNRMIYTSGSYTSTYNKTLQPGKLYYIHFGYYKNGSTNSNNDTFTINSVYVNRNNKETFSINNNGQYTKQLSAGEYSLKETVAPLEYEVPANSLDFSVTRDGNTNIVIENNKLKGTVITHHYIEGTEIKVPSNNDGVIDDVITEYPIHSNYTTSASTNINSEYELVNVPENALGKINGGTIEVTYYYRIKNDNLNIEKVDSLTNEKLENAKFKVKQIDTREEPENVITEINKYNLTEENYTFNVSQYDSYSFASVNNKWMPVNSGAYWQTQTNNTPANSYIQLYNIENGTYKVIVNAEISSAEDDYGWATITSSSPSSSETNTKFINISGKVESANYESQEFEYNSSGNSYFVNFGYTKTGTTVAGDDTFTINSVKLVNVNTHEEIDITNRMSRYNQYYFEKFGNQYISTSNRAYANSNSRGYFAISPSRSGKYIVVINAESKIEASDSFYSIFKLGSPSSDMNDGGFMNISGTNEAKNYMSGIVEYEKNGSPMYLTVNYIKDNSLGGPADGVTINSIKLYRIEGSSGSEKIGATYTSQNKHIDNSVSYGVIPLDLREHVGKYTLTVNAEVSSEEGKDFGYAYISDSNAVTSPIENETFMYISGEKEAVDYTKTIQGGKQYYLHIGYKKDESGNSGTDRLVVNSVNLTLSDEDLFEGEVITNENGIGTLNIPYGKYEITEMEEPEGYYLLEEPITFNFTVSGNHTISIEDAKIAKVIVHHYIKGTEEKLAEDEEIEGKVGEEYETNPHLDLEKYELEKNENGENIVPSNKEGNMTYEDIEVIYYYVKKKGTVKVNHFVDGTEERIRDLDGNTVEQEVKQGEIGTGYVTKERDDLGNKYEYISGPTETSGIYSEGEITLSYYYRIKKYPYVVNYLLKDNDEDYTNNTVLHEQKAEPENYDYGTTINSEDEIIDIDGYIVDTSTVENIKITETGNVLNIYYIKDSTKTKTISYTVEYYKDGVLQENDTQVESIEVHILDGDTLEVDQTKINVTDKYAGYEFKESDPERIPTIAVNGEVIKIYYVAKIGKVTINHIDKNDPTNILETELKEGKYGETIETTSKDFDEYMLVESPATEEYTYKEEDQVVNYYYAKVSSGVLVKHLDLITGKPLAEDVLIEGYEGKPYETTTIEIDGYYVTKNKELYNSIIKENPNFLEDYGAETLDEFFEERGIVGTANYIPEEAEGLMKDTLITVRYYYTPKVKLIVKYIDILTGEEIQEEIGGELVDSTINQVGNIDDEYETNSKDFNNYLRISNKTYYRMFITSHPEALEEAGVTTLEEYLEKENIDPNEVYEPENADGNLRILVNDDGTYSDEIVVIYYYGPEREVLVKYYDKVTGEEIAEEVVKVGPDGDPYSVAEEKKEIEGYTLVQEPTDPEGVYEETNEPRKFYYAKNTKVIVKYVDKDTNTVIDSSKNYNIEGYEGKEYKAEKKDFENYNFVEDTNNTEGTMKREEIQVVYYYSKVKEPTNTDNGNNDNNNDTPTKPTNQIDPKNETNKPNTVVTNNEPKTTPISTVSTGENTNNDNNNSSNNKKSVITRIVKPSTGDVLPAAVFSIVIVLIISNTLIVLVTKEEKNSRYTNKQIRTRSKRALIKTKENLKRSSRMERLSNIESEKKVNKGRRAR